MPVRKTSPKKSTVKPKIKVTKDGPYLAYGITKMVQEEIVPNAAGQSDTCRVIREYEVPSDKPVALCRCGGTNNPPFCTGAHLKNGFDGTETADFEDILANVKEYRGKKYTLLDNEKYCAFARFCDANGQIWNLIGEKTDQTDKMAMEQAFKCPSGRLMMRDDETNSLVEPKMEQSISALEDPIARCSACLYIRGGIPVESADGKTYQVHNRQTLCRCGRSSKKPFCDGSHASLADEN